MGATIFTLISGVVSITLALELGCNTTSTHDESRGLDNTVDNSKADTSSTSTLKGGEGATRYDAAYTAMDASGSGAL